MANLIIIADITAKDDKVEAVKAEALKLLAPTRSEKGCVSYHLQQDNVNPAHLVFFEVWESRDLWQQHLAGAPLQGFVNATKDDLAGFVVSEMSQIEA